MAHTRKNQPDDAEDLLDAKRLRFARRSDRIRSCSHDLQQIDRIIEGRTRYFEHLGVTEGEDPHGVLTGLVRARRRLVGKGASAEIETEYTVDLPFLRERLNLLRQIGQEVGDVDTAPKTGSSESVNITIIDRVTADHESIPD